MTREEMKNALRLYAVTDRRWLKEQETLAAALEEVLQNGATMVQLREKELGNDAFIREAKELQKLCRSYHIPCIINDRVDVALAVDADGVHVGQEDIRGRDIRALLGPDKILGITAKTVAQAKAAEAAGADYLGSGAVFGSATKSDARNLSAEQLKAITASVQIPVVAIGGIDAGNVLRLKGLGISGIAVVSGIFAAAQPASAARALRALSEELLND